MDKKQIADLRKNNRGSVSIIILIGILALLFITLVYFIITFLTVISLKKEIRKLEYPNLPFSSIKTVYPPFDSSFLLVSSSFGTTDLPRQIYKYYKSKLTNLEYSETTHIPFNIQDVTQKGSQHLPFRITLEFTNKKDKLVNIIISVSEIEKRHVEVIVAATNRD